MKKLLVVTSIIELAVGVSLIIIPALILNLLFGIDRSDALTVVGRFTGVAITCFGISCYPSMAAAAVTKQSPSFRAMFAYNVLAGLYIGFILLSGRFDGILLLPAIILHTSIAVYFVYIILKERS